MTIPDTEAIMILIAWVVAGTALCVAAYQRGRAKQWMNRALQYRNVSDMWRLARKEAEGKLNVRLTLRHQGAPLVSMTLWHAAMLAEYGPTHENYVQEFSMADNTFMLYFEKSETPGTEEPST